MRRLLFAVPFICLAMPVAAQPSGVSPEIDKVLVCATMFSLKAEDDKAIGDDGGHLEWSMRADELANRGGLMLGEAGFDATDIENTQMNYALTAGLEAGLGAPRFSFEDCQVFVE